MEKGTIVSTYIDLKKGQVPIDLNFEYDLGSGKLKNVDVKAQKGTVAVDAKARELFINMGQQYVDVAEAEIKRQAMKLGMANFAQRFPLISLAVQNPNLYMANLFTLMTNGLRTKNIQVAMAVIDTALKAKEGVFPDPLPAPIMNKIDAQEYKRWGNEVWRRLDKVAKQIGEGRLEKNPFDAIPKKDMDEIIKLTQKTAEYYSKAAMG